MDGQTDTDPRFPLLGLLSEPKRQSRSGSICLVIFLTSNAHRMLKKTLECSKNTDILFIDTWVTKTLDLKYSAGYKQHPTMLIIKVKTFITNLVYGPVSSWAYLIT